MKKAIIGFMVLAIGGIMVFTSCKKDNTNNEPQLQNVTSLAKFSTKADGQAASFSVPENLGEPTGILDISEDLFSASLAGAVIICEPTGGHTYKAIGQSWDFFGDNPKLELATPYCKDQLRIWQQNIANNWGAYQSLADNSGRPHTEVFAICPELHASYTWFPKNPGTCPLCTAYNQFQAVYESGVIVE